MINLSQSVIPQHGQSLDALHRIVENREGIDRFQLLNMASFREKAEPYRFTGTITDLLKEIQEFVSKNALRP